MTKIYSKLTVANVKNQECAFDVICKIINYFSFNTYYKFKN